MAWANRGRISSSLIRQKRKNYHALRPENPHGVPKAVMKGLAALRIVSADKETYSRELQTLMELSPKMEKANGEIR
jgi:hypothetical protein